MAMKVCYTVINGEVTAENRGGIRSLYVPDPLGSTVALLDNTQAQTDTFSYWPYGESRTRMGTTPTPFQFLGTVGYYTDSTSKAYVRARTMDSRKGRWLTQDPIGFNGGDVNLYRYVASMPISNMDPSGTGPRDYPGWDKNCRQWNGSGWHSCSKAQWDACLAKCGAGNVDHCCSNGDRFGGPMSGSGFGCGCINPLARHAPPVRKAAPPRKTSPPDDGVNYPGDIDTHQFCPPPAQCRYRCTNVSRIFSDCDYTCTLLNNTPGCPRTRTYTTGPMPSMNMLGDCAPTLDIIGLGTQTSEPLLPQ